MEGIEGIMSIQKNVFVLILILSVLTFLTSPVRAIDTEGCKACHGYVKPLSPTNITKDCSACHNNGGHQDSPSTRVPTEVHPNHEALNSPLTSPKCTVCHSFPPACTKCHNTHEIVQSVKATITNPLNISNCVGCHGVIPEPYGHTSNRDALSKSSHSWMNCRTCHINTYVNGVGTEFDLHFKDMLTTPIQNSINLCKICHSFYYDQLENGKHGDPSKKCVDCHNPHTTDTTGKILTDKSKDNSVNVSVQLDSAGNWLTTKVPILKNTAMVYVILTIIIVTLAEFFLSKHEEGKKVAYNMVKFQEDEDTLKTLEVKLKNQDIDPIRYILEINGINILGMTMTKEDEKDKGPIYKYVIFMNMDRPLDTDMLAEKISAMDNVEWTAFSEEYEL